MSVLEDPMSSRKFQVLSKSRTRGRSEKCSDDVADGTCLAFYSFQLGFEVGEQTDTSASAAVMKGASQLTDNC